MNKKAQIVPIPMFMPMNSSSGGGGGDSVLIAIYIVFTVFSILIWLTTSFIIYDFSIELLKGNLGRLL
jgi:hypothetical protein